MDLASKTVLELRKIAKDHNIKLSSGINKAEIIQRLEEALASSDGENTEQLDMLSSLSPDSASAQEESEDSNSPSLREDDTADDEESEDPEMPDEEEQTAEAKPVRPLFSSPIPSIPSIPSVPTPYPASQGTATRTPSAPANTGQPHYRSSWHNAQSTSQNKFSPAAR